MKYTWLVSWYIFANIRQFIHTKDWTDALGVLLVQLQLRNGYYWSTFLSFLPRHTVHSMCPHPSGRVDATYFMETQESTSNHAWGLRVSLWRYHTPPRLTPPPPLVFPVHFFSAVSVSASLPLAEAGRWTLTLNVLFVSAAVAAAAAVLVWGQRVWWTGVLSAFDVTVWNSEVWNPMKIKHVRWVLTVMSRVCSSYTTGT